MPEPTFDLSKLPGPLKSTAKASSVLVETVNEDRELMKQTNETFGLTGFFKKILEGGVIVLAIIFVLFLIVAKIFL